jgi:hypothetical protein
MGEPTTDVTNPGTNLGMVPVTRLTEATLPGPPVADSIGDSGTGVWEDKGWADATGETLTPLSAGGLISLVAMTSGSASAQVVNYPKTVALWEGKGWATA